MSIFFRPTDQEQKMLDQAKERLGLKTYTAVLREGLKAISSRLPKVESGAEVKVPARLNLVLNTEERIQVGDWQRRYTVKTPAEAVKIRLFSKYNKSREPVDNETLEKIKLLEREIDGFKDLLRNIYRADEVRENNDLHYYLGSQLRKYGILV